MDLVAISPHLDDAVLGCAGLMAAHPGATVVTVTAGRPGPHPLTDWDRTCGFADGDDVVGARRAEDKVALALLHADPVWLDFLDRQYADGKAPDPVQVAAALRPIAGRAALIASPLGLMHPDHIAVATACALLRPAGWVVYEDAIYRAHEGAAGAALAAMRQTGVDLEPVDVPDAPAKREAIAAYTSQVKGLAHLLDDAYRPERYWRVKVR